MRIKQIGIKNFGIFTNFTLDLTQGMNFILGENEAGKSTLLAFIRWVLFGFPKGKTEKYTPINGGVQCGHLLLMLPDGRECLVRRQGRTGKGDLTILIDGETEPGDTLTKLLGPISENVYRNVFAFGLDELQTLNTLTDNEVSSFLYSSGLYPGNLSLSKIDIELEKRAKEYYSPNKIATRPLLNQKLTELEELETGLARLQKEPEEYNQCLKDEEKTQNELAEIKKELANLEEKRHWLNTLSQGWKLWKEKCSLQDNIAALGIPEEFPEARVLEAEALLKEIASCEEELAQVRIRQSKQQEDLKECQVDYNIIAHEAEIGALYSDLSKVTDWKAKCQELTAKIDELNKQLQSRIPTELGSEYDHETLLSLHLAPEVNEQIRSWQDKLTDNKESLRQSKEKLVSLETEKQGLIKEEETVLKELETLQVRQNFYQVKEALETYKQLAPSRDYLKQRVEDLQTPSNKPIVSSGWATIIGTVLIALLSSYFLIIKKWYLGVPGLIFALYNLLSYLSVKKQEKIDLLAWQSEEEERMEKLARIKQELEQIQRQFAEAEGILGFVGNVEPELIKTLTEELIKENEVLMKRHRQEERLVEIRQKLQSLGKQITLTKEVIQEQDQERNTNDTNWQLFLQSKNLPNKEPLAILEWLSAARELLARTDELTEREQDKKALTKNIEEYRQKVHNLASVLERDKLSDPEVAVLDWQNRLKKNMDSNQKKNDINKVLEELKIKEEDLLHKHQVKSEIVKEIFCKAEVETPDEFRALAKKAEEKKQLETSIIVIESNLKNLVRDKQEELLQELSELSDISLEKQLKENNDALTKSKDLETDANERLGRLAEKLNQLEQSEEAEKLLARQANITSEMNSLAKKWAEAEICRYLINKARMVYEREKQPGVLKTASRFFNEITGGRYTKVISPLGEQRFEVVSSNQELKKPEELSRGTVEQLYLCLRLGLIEEFARQQNSLPLVIDDILVNFDPKRSRNTLEILASIQSTHQVLFFTCQPHLVNIAKENKLDHNLIVLKDGAVVV